MKMSDEKGFATENEKVDEFHIEESDDDEKPVPLSPGGGSGGSDGGIGQSSGPASNENSAGRVAKALYPRAVYGGVFSMQEGPTAAQIAAGYRDSNPIVEVAEIALEFYNKNHQDAEFEVVHGYFYETLDIAHPDWKSEETWYHVSFNAKPKYASAADDVSPIHFFGELQLDKKACIYAKYCYTFEPSDHDPGFKHGCIICPTDEKFQNFHPRKGECMVGFEPYYEVEFYYDQ